MSNQPQFDPGELGSPEGAKAALGVGEAGRRVELDGVTLAWEEAGEGVPVICLHGAGHGASDFHPLQQKFPMDCRLLLLDWPGHGRSGGDRMPFTLERCVDLLTRFMNSRGLRDAVLMGSEFGAAVALAFAVKHPARVRGLVLSEPAGLVAPLAPRRFSRLGATLRRGARAVLRQQRVTPLELQLRRVDELQQDHALEVNHAALSLLAHQDALRSALAEAPCSILVALAQKSRAWPLKRFQHFLAPLIGSSKPDRPGRIKLAIFSGTGSPLWESPARLACVLSGFAGATRPLAAHRHSWTIAAADWPARGMNQWHCTHPGCAAALALSVDQDPNAPQNRR